jgi:hypothetical protein
MPEPDEKGETASQGWEIGFGPPMIDILAFCNGMPRSVAKAEIGGAPNVSARRENNERGLAVISCIFNARAQDRLLTCPQEQLILLRFTPANNRAVFFAPANEACSLQIRQGFFP